ncbi:hypothetical protein NC652_033700 [Populus alba x Populus x berolinensis]|nr:hypothetical protein NC652_033700 [Populus alba x Populus x berolinensis]
MQQLRSRGSSLFGSQLKRKALNSWTAIQDTYFSTVDIFERHKVVFTIGTSVASVATAWAGYSLRHLHDSKVDQRLEGIENAMKKNYHLEHAEFKKLVDPGHSSVAACIATAGTAFVIGVNEKAFGSSCCNVKLSDVIRRTKLFSDKSQDGMAAALAPSVGDGVCASMIEPQDYICEEHPNCCLNSSIVDVFLSHEPQSTATKNMIHISQMIRAGTIAMYDYDDDDDDEKNREHYGQTSPPVNNMTSIPNDLPLFLSYGGADALSDINDVQLLLDSLKDHEGDKLVKQYRVDHAHADYVMSANAKQDNSTSVSSLNAKDGICKSVVEPLGYACQEHTVTTKDGYILSLQRMPSGLSGQAADKPPVLLQHGLIVDGVTWLMSLPDESLAFILADNGYDVWISNGRGTRFSRGHASIDPYDSAYWDWTWDELAAYDLPATFQYVHEQTGQNLHYVGHSQGTLIALAAFSQGKLLNMLRSAVLLCPVAYLNHLTSPFARGLVDLFVAEDLYWLGQHEFSLRGPVVNKLLEDICIMPGIDCSDLLTAITGI